MKSLFQHKQKSLKLNCHFCIQHTGNGITRQAYAFLNVYNKDDHLLQTAK